MLRAAAERARFHTVCQTYATAGFGGFLPGCSGADELKSDIPCRRASKVSSRGPLIRPSDLRQSRTFGSTIEHDRLAAAGRAKPTVAGDRGNKPPKLRIRAPATLQPCPGLRACAGSACPTIFIGGLRSLSIEARTASRQKVAANTDGGVRHYTRGESRNTYRAAIFSSRTRMTSSPV
jgi:hypothetical protein